MAREVLYRRSFQLDRDLREVENFFELDRVLVTAKSTADSRMVAVDGGFEAPRNSLDVPFSGSLEARRNSEVRCEEIPIGYELSRSLTTRRKKEDYFNLKPSTSASEPGLLKPKGNAANMNPNLDCKAQPRVPSVVARLMGLDALPHQEASQGSHHSSLRRVLREEYDASYTLPTSNHANVSVCSSEYVVPVEEAGFEELSFRNHPQEKQLQEFKREFTARQTIQGRSSLSGLNLESLSMQHKSGQIGGLDHQMDSDEFLDALDFLNTNKDFFVKILSDPQSSFSRHLQQGSGSVSSLKDVTRQHVRPKSTKCSSECGVHPSTEVLAGWKKRQDVHQSAAANKVRVMRNLRWGRDDEMPGRLQWRARGVSTLRSGGKVGTDGVVATRIVVLKPNLGRQPSGKGSSPSSPLLRPDGILRFRTEGRENMKQDAKVGGHLRSDGGLAMEFFRDDFKDGPFDARTIAKRIVKHVKDDMSQRPAREGINTQDSSGRRVPPIERVNGLPGDGNGSVDGDIFQRATREAGKVSSSNLPCSPRVFKLERETEHWHPSFNGRKGYHMEETKGSSYKQLTSPIKSSKEQCNEGAVHGNQGPSRKENGGKESKPVKRTCRSNSLKVRDLKCEAPRVLPRSLSAPAAPCVENRALEHERGVFSVERATCSSRAKLSENSAFKERLLSLKDSFSLSKKRGSRKPGPAQCSLSLNSSSDRPLLRYLGGESTDSIEPCNMFPCQAIASETQEVSKEVVEKSLNEMISESSLMPSGFSQWTSITDLAADTASETSLDKSEQPSPVSVLETPFQEESPSCGGKGQEESKCCEYTCGLSHVGSDCKGLPRSLQGTFLSQPCSPHRSFDSSTYESLNTWNLIESHLESFGLCDVACPLASEEELTYIMHVLSLSGLNVNGLVMAHSLSSEHGLNQSLFGRLEAYYDHRFSREASLAPLNPSSRRLLFDVVDEVIASALKKRLLQPWTMSSNQRVLVCTGKQLLEQIVAHVRYHRFVLSDVEEDALEDMASRDLMREAPWVHSHSDTEAVVIELERLLCGDLIRELVRDLRS